MRNRQPEIIAILMVLLPIAGQCADDNQQLIIVPTSALTHYWAVDDRQPFIGPSTTPRPMPENLAYFEGSGMDENSAGCVNIGFIINKNGKTAAPRILKEAKDARSLRRKDYVGLGIGLLAFQPYMHNGMQVGLLQYAASEENADHASIFTSFPFVYISKTLAKKLNDSEKKNFIDALRHSCDIEDLSSWVKEHGVKNSVIVAAPDPPLSASGG